MSTTPVGVDCINGSFNGHIRGLAQFESKLIVVGSFTEITNDTGDLFTAEGIAWIDCDECNPAWCTSSQLAQIGEISGVLVAGDTLVLAAGTDVLCFNLGETENRPGVATDTGCTMLRPISKSSAAQVRKSVGGRLFRGKSSSGSQLSQRAAVARRRAELAFVDSSDLEGFEVRTMSKGKGGEVIVCYTHLSNNWEKASSGAAGRTPDDVGGLLDIIRNPKGTETASRIAVIDLRSGERTVVAGPPGDFVSAAYISCLDTLVSTTSYGIYSLTEDGSWEERFAFLLNGFTPWASSVCSDRLILGGADRSREGASAFGVFDPCDNSVSFDFPVTAQCGGGGYGVVDFGGHTAFYGSQLSVGRGTERGYPLLLSPSSGYGISPVDLGDTLVIDQMLPARLGGRKGLLVNSISDFDQIAFAVRASRSEVLFIDETALESAVALH